MSESVTCGCAWCYCPHGTRDPRGVCRRCRQSKHDGLAKIKIAGKVKENA